VVDQAGLLWAIAHTVIARYRRDHPEWAFVRHEDLARRPEPGFAELCARLGLEDGPAVRRAIAVTTAADNPAEAAPGVIHELRRSSAESVRSWRSRLTPAEVARVRDATADVWPEFYSDEEW
jgi:hypothetical protein